MRKHCTATLFFLFGWALLAPTSWVGAIQASVYIGNVVVTAGASQNTLTWPLWNGSVAVSPNPAFFIIRATSQISANLTVASSTAYTIASQPPGSIGYVTTTTASPAAGTTFTFTDVFASTGGVAGTPYFYVVVPMSNASPSKTYIANPPPPPYWPLTVSNLVATPGTGQVQLNWILPSGGMALNGSGPAFYILRSSTQDGALLQPAAGSSAATIAALSSCIGNTAAGTNTFTDVFASTGGVAGTTYYYSVVAMTSTNVSMPASMRVCPLTMGANGVSVAGHIYPLATAASPAPSGYGMNGTDTTLSGNNIYNYWYYNFNPAEFYTVFLTAGQTYIISNFTGTTSSTSDTEMSLQYNNPTTGVATQVAYNNDAQLKAFLGYQYASQIIYTVPAGQSGMYTIVVTYDSSTLPLAYTLTIPNPTPTVGSITLPSTGTYTSSGFQLSSSSYYGTAAVSTPSNPGLPTASTSNLGSVNYANFPWANFEQNWYTVNLTPGASYSITMTTASGTTPVLALQYNNGTTTTQVGYASAATTATLPYVVPAGNTGTYTLICSQATSTSATTAFTLTIPQPTVASIATTTAITSSPSTTIPFAKVSSVTVTVSSGSGTPTGNVTLYVDGTAAGSAALSASGTASFSLFPSIATHALTATYGGGGSFTGSTTSSSTSLTIGPPTPFTLGTPLAGSLTTATYPGGAADTTQSNGNSHFALNTHCQDWYSVALTAGQTYVISAASPGSNNDTFLSLQYNGTQVCWNDDSYLTWLNTGGTGDYCAQIVYTVPNGATGTYYVIVSYDGATVNATTSVAYTLTIPVPTAPTPISLGTLPSSGTFTSSVYQLDSTSFYGAGAAGTLGSSPATTPPTISNWTSNSYMGTTLNPVPAWVDYQQNWYSVALTGGQTYNITLQTAGTAPAGSWVLALQDASNNQVTGGYAVGNTTSVTLQYTVPAVPVGPYTIICSQNKSTNATAQFTLSIPIPVVPTIATTTTITSAPTTTVPFAKPVSVTVAVTSDSGTPSGNVTLSVDGVAGTPTALNASGTATFSLFPSAGTHSLTASYTGVGAYFSSTSSPATNLTVGPATLINVGQSVASTITTSNYIGNAADTTMSGTSGAWGYYNSHYTDWWSVVLQPNQTYVISTFVSGNFDTMMSLQFNGTQVAYNNDSGLNWLGYQYASQMIYTVPPSAAGTYTMVVTYSSTPSGFNSTGCPYTLLVANPTPTVTSIDPLPAAGTYTSPTSTTYQLSQASFYGPGAASSLGSPSTSPGSIGSSYVGSFPQPWPAYADWWQSWYSVTLTGGASYTFTMTSPGVVPVLSLQNGAYGSGATQVAYNAGTATAAATFTYPVPTGAGGVYYIVCTQNTKPASQSTTVPFTLAVAAPATTTTITATTPTSPTDAFVPVTVTAANGAIPTGSVTLTDTTTGTVFGPQALDGTGATTFDISNAGGGPHALSAAYASTTTPVSFQPSTGSGSITVPASTQTIITAPTVTLPTNATVTVTVAAEYGTAAPTGNVTLFVDGATPGITMALSSSSSSTQATATFTLTGLTANTSPGHSLTATYQGVAGFFASQATEVNLVVNPQPPPASTKTTISTASIVLPNNGSVTVTVTSGAGTPTGSVTLTVDGKPLPAQTLTGGSTTFTIPNPGPGNHTLQATYSGDMTFIPGFAGSFSPQGFLTVGIPNVKLAPPADRRDDVAVLGLHFEPAASSVVRPVSECWISTSRILEPPVVVGWVECTHEPHRTLSA